MGAWEMVEWWANEKSRELRLKADRAEHAYTKDPLASACRAYADRLRAAADLLDEPLRPAGAADEGSA